MSSASKKWVSLGVAVLLLLIAASFLNWKFVATLRPLVVAEWWRPLAIGGLISLSITGCAVALGLTLGIFIAVVQWLPSGRVVRFLLHAYIEIGRNVPLIVQLFWVHFALPLMTGISTSAFVSGFIALAFQSSAYLADTIRGGIQAVGKGQWAAANALALPQRYIWIDIVLPQALRTMLPAIGNLAASSLNASALLSLLSVGELMSVSTKISDYAMRPIEIMTATALLYLMCNLVISGLFALLERKFPGEAHAS